jgi:FkbH-like protein
MIEAVRLLIWDLDDTYWRGTLTEGGITEYVREHHDIVIKLAQRGIMSSICSKNDEVKVMEILKREGIADYFIFPSISWGPKATRLASIIEAVQLRPATVMFIDDNHLNRAEVADLLPDLQIEDETFLTRLLSDPRFKGRDDSGLTRLAQYKVLEQRKRDEVKAEGNSEKFLRGCDVRVYVEYDVERHIDRAVELINRTNQLNFTKVRLSEDPEKARTELSALLRDPFRQSGLIRVVDKYGDYGFVGIYMVTSGAASGVVDPNSGRLVERLDHFCFSCRTLGMLVEAWVYDYLQRPHIKIVGEVLTDITVARPIDWIRLASAGDSGTHTNAAQKVFPEIRVHGGCEANSVTHYLMPYADHITVTGNFHAGNVFCRVNGSTLLLSACDRSERSLESEADALGIPRNMLVTDYFNGAPAGAAFVFGGQFDRNGSLRYRHNQYGWEICVEPYGLEGVDLVSTASEDILARLAALNCTDAAKSDIAKIALHIHENYESAAFSQERDLRPAMEEIFSRVPLGSKLVLITDHARVRDTDGEVTDAPWSANYHAAITAIAAPHSFVRVVSFKDHIRNEEEINVGGNHYHRMVYLRMAEAIIEELTNTPPKTAELRRTAEAASVVRMCPPPSALDDATYTTQHTNENAMNQSELGPDAIQTLAALLDDEDGRKMFVDAVYSAFLEKHASTNRAYNIDNWEISRLAAAIESHRYASQKMIGVPRFQHRNDLLNFACKNITVDGPSLEFGVWSGHSINLIASLLPSSKVYGFDSFEGLPEAWFGKADGIGQFSRNGELPQVRENVELVVGWFDHVLAPFLDTHEFEKIALLHIDCDIYSSTQTVFSYLYKKIVPGTVIVFDEYLNYPTWQRHEYAAFQEFVGNRQIKYEYLGLVPGDMQVAVRILAV